MQRRLIREPEARDYLGGISHATLHALRKKGDIIPLHIGRTCLYDVADLDIFIDTMHRVEDERLA